MRKHIQHFIAVVLIAAAAAGCKSPPSHFYTLNATATSHGTRAFHHAVFVGPVTVPAEVDRPQFTLQITPNQLAIDEFNRWAEPLNDAIARAVAGDLSVLLGTSRVTASRVAGLNYTYRVSLNIQQFVSVPGKLAQVDAIWTIHKLPEGTVFSGRTEAAEPVHGKSFDELAAAHSRALAKISGDIAAVIRGGTDAKP